MLKSDAIRAAKYRYHGDAMLTIADDEYDDVWECDGGYEVRAYVFVPHTDEQETD